MKIVYLHQYFNTPDMPGGTRSYEMARRWVAAGHEVHIVTTSREEGKGLGWRNSIEDGVHVHWRKIPYSNSMGAWRRMLAFMEFVLAAAPKARSLRGDVIFATSTPLTIVLPGIYASAFRKSPIVFEVRDLWPTMPIAAGYLRNPVLKIAAFSLERVAYRCSRKIVALSEDMAAGIARAGAPIDKIVVAPNSCDVETLDVDVEIGIRYRAMHCWLKERPFVVYCGTIGMLNNLSYLVSIADRMRLRNPSVAFGVYGIGKEEGSVRALAAHSGVLNVNFYMLGEIPKRQVAEVLSAASVTTSLFLPISDMHANSANKFFDGLAAAKPVAINYGGWQADILKSTGAGITLDPYDPDLACAQLDEFLCDRHRLAAASEAATKLAYHRFSRDSIAFTVLSVIQESVGGRVGPKISK